MIANLTTTAGASPQQQNDSNKQGGAHAWYSVCGYFNKAEQPSHCNILESDYLHQLIDMHWHFINLCRVVLLYVSQNFDVIIPHKIYRNTITPKTSRPSNTMYV